MTIVAAIGGGFKAPHAGHLKMIQHYADMSDKVLLYIGSKARPIANDSYSREITAQQSKAVWEAYLYDSNLSNKVQVQIFKGSPMKATFSVLESASPGQTIYLARGEHDNHRYPQHELDRYTPEGVLSFVKPCPTIINPNTGERYSGTLMRETIRFNDLNSFTQYLPQSSQHRSKELYKLLGGMDPTHLYGLSIG